jgi:hypothetical protein
MVRSVCVAAMLGILGLAPAPPGKYEPVSLDAKGNQKLSDNFGSGREGNNLVALKKGLCTCGGVNFVVEEKMIQLGSSVLKVEKPDKVEGIKVDKKLVKLHFLHATGYGSSPEGNALHIKDGTKIAEYKVHYDDKTSAIVPVVYGEDVRDWWTPEGAAGVSRGKVAWKGENEVSKEFMRHLRLYLTSWDNPHPEKTVVAIDYIRSDSDTAAAPFCVAVTAETE